MDDWCIILWGQKEVPSLKDVCENSFLVSNSAHASSYTAKVKHPHRDNKQNTLWLEGGNSHSQPLSVSPRGKSASLSSYTASRKNSQMPIWVCVAFSNRAAWHGRRWILQWSTNAQQNWSKWELPRVFWSLDWLFHKRVEYNQPCYHIRGWGFFFFFRPRVWRFMCLL